MDMNSQGVSQDLPEVHDDGSYGLVVDHPDLLTTCFLCRQPFSRTIGLTGDYEAACGDCKFLLLEDYGNPFLQSRQRLSTGRRNSRSSSESTDHLFSQQFSRMLDVVRQTESVVLGHESERVDGDAAGGLLQHSSSHMTPSGSRRWRQGFSDSESDGFDNLGSLYWEGESNISFGGHRVFHGGSDVTSFSANGGDSDASVDGPSFQSADLFSHPDEDSELETNTDIDPMHTASNLWDLNDPQEDDEAEGSEWEQVEMEENTVETIGAGTRLPNFRALSSGESIGRVTIRRQFHLRSANNDDGLNHWRFMEDRHSHTPHILGNDDRSVSHANSADYGNGRHFEELLEHLAEMDSSLRQVAPPTATSFVNSLPHMIIKEEHLKHDTLACAICKDLLAAGTEVNQLPCSHVYHPDCILPWLSSRNSCPLCRYKLPTDDKDNEGDKQRTGSQMEILEIQLQQQGASEDSDSDVYFDGAGIEEVCEPVSVVDAADDSGSGSSRDNRRGRWFFLAAAAPIVSLVGYVLVLWVGRGRGPMGCCDSCERQTHASSNPPTSPPARETPPSSSSSRCWSFF